MIFLDCILINYKMFIRYVISVILSEEWNSQVSTLYLLVLGSLPGRQKKTNSDSKPKIYLFLL